MKKLILWICFQFLWTTAFPQERPWPAAIHVQRTNLIVRWKAATHPWPKVVGIYHAVPTQFSPSVISNLTVLGSFAEKDKRAFGTNGIILGQPYSTPHLDISFAEGKIRYDGRGQMHYSATNLAKAVPEENQLPEFIADFVPKLGIRQSEIAKQRNGKPRFYYTGVETGYFRQPHGGDAISNVLSRRVVFLRDMNGGRTFMDSGRCELNFGVHGRVINIDMSWPELKCEQLYAAATQKEIIRRIQQGQALQRHMHEVLGGDEIVIDWSKVKNLTITNAEVVYFRGETFFVREYAPQLNDPNLVYPDAELSGTVDTGSEKIRVEIVCPIIDQTKPLNSVASESKP
jgi:hypothetical protein